MLQCGSGGVQERSGEFRIGYEQVERCKLLLEGRVEGVRLGVLVTSVVLSQDGGDENGRHGWSSTRTNYDASSLLQMTTLTPNLHLKQGEVNLGTSIMAVAFNGGVVLGADSRTTTGSYIANRVTDKLTFLHNTIYCCRSGSAADTQAIADVAHSQLQLHAVQNEADPTVHIAATLLENLCYSNKDSLSAGIIVAGWDKEKGASVYNIPLGGGLFKAPWAIGGMLPSSFLLILLRWC